MAPCENSDVDSADSHRESNTGSISFPWLRRACDHLQLAIWEFPAGVPMTRRKSVERDPAMPAWRGFRVAPRIARQRLTR